jgi:transposase
MDEWADIRRRVLVEKVSKRQILAETGMHWTTLEKVLTHSAPPGYRRTKPPNKPKIGPHLEWIHQVLEADKSVPRKQRHTAKRVFERLKDERGYTGGYTQVKEAVREMRPRLAEVFVPLDHPPGEAQFDFGVALFRRGGKLCKLPFAVISLPYSGAIWARVYERICTETVQDAHVRAFTFFGGVPHTIVYDNDSTIVAAVEQGRKRRLTDGFLHLKSHYLFQPTFCRIRRGNEKGVVENGVRYVRQSVFVPVPDASDLDRLNADLETWCREDLQRRMRGRSGTKEVRLADDQAVFLPLPAAPLDACRKKPTTVSSLSLVRFDNNEYSVPVHRAHDPVVIKGYVDRVAVCYFDEVVAEHPRLWGREDISFDPLHYLALLEKKPRALDQARPLKGWDLPDCFGVLRRRLESEWDGHGTREYICVLRLLETHALADLTRAIEKGLRCGAITRDAVAQFLYPQEEWRDTTFRLDGREHLRHVKVAQTDVAAYHSLLEGV